jgi:hypothetical protein
MRIYSITAFPNIRQPDRQIKLAYSWTNLCRFLGKEREPVSKIKQGAWSPASFNGKRLNVNVTKLSCLVLDIDSHVDMYEAGANLMVRDVKSYMHSSVSHVTGKNERFRIVLPLAHDAPLDQWPYYFRALRTWWTEVFGADRGFDESTKDPARAYYVGYHTKEWYENHTTGKVLDWEGRARDEAVKYEAELRQRKREQEERRKQAEANRKKVGRQASYSDKRRYMYEMLRNDTGARRDFAVWLGATLKGGKNGMRAVLWSCPRCAKNDCTFFYLDPTRYPSAYCNHRNNCNWKESVGYLAEISGYTL